MYATFFASSSLVSSERVSSCWLWPCRIRSLSLTFSRTCNKCRARSVCNNTTIILINNSHIHMCLYYHTSSIRFNLFLNSWLSIMRDSPLGLHPRKFSSPLTYVDVVSMTGRCRSVHGRTGNNHIVECNDQSCMHSSYQEVSQLFYEVTIHIYQQYSCYSKIHIFTYHTIKERILWQITLLGFDHHQG